MLIKTVDKKKEAVDQLFFTHILEHFITSLAFMRPTG